MGKSRKRRREMTLEERKVRVCTYSKDQVRFALDRLAEACRHGTPDEVRDSRLDALAVGASRALVELVEALPAVEVAPNCTGAILRASGRKALESALDQLEAAGFIRTRIGYAAVGGFQARINYLPGHGLEELHAALGEI